MLSSRRTFAGLFALFGVFVAGAAAGCADTDPHYGTPESIRGRKIDYGTGTAADVPATEAGAGATPRSLFSPIYKSITAGGGDSTVCTPCHGLNGQGGAPFAPPSEDAAYTYFKAQKYNDLMQPKLHSFYNKGQHTGNPLSATQKAATKLWADAENAAGGTTPPADASAGGG